MAHLYILRCANDSLYVGSTDNIEERIKKHKSGWGSHFTRTHGTVHSESAEAMHPEQTCSELAEPSRRIELVYTEEYTTYKEAFKRERQIKGWTRAKKEALITGDIELLKKLSTSK